MPSRGRPGPSSPQASDQAQAQVPDATANAVDALGSAPGQTKTDTTADAGAATGAGSADADAATTTTTKSKKHKKHGD